MIQIEHLNKNFGKKRVLHDVNISFCEGQIHGIVGRNGSGKSVLFKCICGLLPFEDGKILIDGVYSDSIHPPIGKIGALIDSPGFLEYLSAPSNLKLLCDLSHTPYSRISESLRMVGLEGVEQPVRTFSLGMRQRLSIAQSILEDYPILILDEPMNSLDECAVALVKKLILESKAQGKTILMASHVAEDVNELCDTITHMQDGKILAR